MAPPSSSHQPLISTLTTFYTLLADLQYYPPTNIIFPLPSTGRHSAGRINVTAAHENGFGPEVIDLLYQLPYLSDTDEPLAYDTEPLNYLDEGSEEAFSFAKDPTYQDLFSNHVFPEHVVVLTRGIGAGVEVLHDVRSCINPSEADLADWEREASGYEKERTLRAVFVRCGWDVTKVEEDVADEEVIWERLEGARRAAGERFDGALFQREKENWEMRTYTGLQ